MGTTTNGLPYPESTDFVTDGAQAIEDLAVDVDAKMGLWLVKSQTINTGTTTVTITGAFPSGYKNFLILGRSFTRSALGIIDVQIGGITTSVYQHNGISMNAGSTTVTGVGTTLSTINAVRCDNTTGGNFDIQIFNPNQAARKDAFVRGMSGSSLYLYGIHVASTTAGNDLIVSTAGGATFGGNIRVYGYRE